MSARRPASTTFQPASSSTCAVARPMPLPPPVTTAIFPCAAMILCLPSVESRPAAPVIGAVPEQVLILRRAGEGGEHRVADCRRCGGGGAVGDVDDGAHGLAEARVGVGVDPGAVRVVSSPRARRSRRRRPNRSRNTAGSPRPSPPRVAGAPSRADSSYRQGSRATAPQRRRLRDRPRTRRGSGHAAPARPRSPRRRLGQTSAMSRRRAPWPRRSASTLAYSAR